MPPTCDSSCDSDAVSKGFSSSIFEGSIPPLPHVLCPCCPSASRSLSPNEVQGMQTVGQHSMQRCDSQHAPRCYLFGHFLEVLSFLFLNTVPTEQGCCSAVSCATSCFSPRAVLRPGGASTCLREHISNPCAGTAAPCSPWDKTLHCPHRAPGSTLGPVQT